MNIDFSLLNLQYLIQVNQLARQDVALTAAVTGLPKETATVLGALTPANLADISIIKLPLIAPHSDHWWWSRLFTALSEERQEEVNILLEQAALIQCS